MSTRGYLHSGGRIDVGILGATGVVGQQFVALLADHPWFRVTWLAASERSAGQRYGDLAWRLPTRLPADVAALRVSPLDDGRRGAVAPLLRPRLVGRRRGGARLRRAADATSSATRANHRMDPLVPLLIPEVNPDHLALLDQQRRARGWTGSLVTNPNCATIVVAMVLGALRQFQPRRDHGDDDAGAVGRRAIRASRRSTRSATSSPTSAAARKRRSRPKR